MEQQGLCMAGMSEAQRCVCGGGGGTVWLADTWSMHFRYYSEEEEVFVSHTLSSQDQNKGVHI